MLKNRLRQLNDPRLIKGARKTIRARRRGLAVVDTVLKTAAALDQWLRQHFGRPYTALLSLGLVLGIAEGFSKFGHAIAAAEHVNAWGMAFVVVFQGALLTNQLAQFNAQREARRAERAQNDGGGGEVAPNLEDVP